MHSLCQHVKIVESVKIFESLPRAFMSCVKLSWAVHLRLSDAMCKNAADVISVRPTLYPTFRTSQ